LIVYCIEDHKKDSPRKIEAITLVMKTNHNKHERDFVLQVRCRDLNNSCINLGILWEFFENSLGILWEFFGNSLGNLWEIFGNSLGILWEFFGKSLGILWEFFGNSLGIFKELPLVVFAVHGVN
jgi:hypothetical protein